MWAVSGAGSCRSPRIRIALRKYFVQGCVVLVDVVVEVNDSILSHDHGGIDDQHRNRMGKIDLLRRTSIHRRTDAIHVPAGIIAQNPDSQIRRPLQPNAPMAEIPRDCENNCRAGVSCKYTLKLFGKMNFTSPSEFLGPGLVAWHADEGGRS